MADKTEASISQGQGYGFRNQQDDAENGRIRKSTFRKKVGSMVSTVFCKPSKLAESGSGSQSHANDEAMTKLNNMVQSLHLRVKGGEDNAEGPKSRRTSTYSKYMRNEVRAEDKGGEGSGPKPKPKPKRGVSEILMGGRSKKEVWRKRILRGGKCRPLNGSWIIHYDENGVLIP
ncbi:hypothetical protein V6N13_019956 [Hibiscus sabdariffa]|uniref:Uncharacterized protein n=1 Tax=Hibiscus sabdariffa TaxID=183260 RepID=A0ABR2ERZ6_9ROSI